MENILEYQTIIVQQDKEINSKDLIHLRFIYTPIVGVPAIALYQFLYDFSFSKKPGSELSFSTIKAFLKITDAEFIKYRKLLEASGLIKTYLSNGHQKILINLKKPLKLNKIKEHAKPLENVLINKLGQKHYQELIDLLPLYNVKIKDKEYEDISDSFINHFRLDNTVQAVNDSTKNVVNNENKFKLNTLEFIKFHNFNVSPTGKKYIQEFLNQGFNYEAINHFINFSLQKNNTISWAYISKIVGDFVKCQIFDPQDVQLELEERNNLKKISNPQNIISSNTTNTTSLNSTSLFTIPSNIANIVKKEEKTANLKQNDEKNIFLAKNCELNMDKEKKDTLSIPLTFHKSQTLDTKTDNDPQDHYDILKQILDDKQATEENYPKILSMFLQIPEMEIDIKASKVFLDDIKDQSSFILLKESFYDIYEMKKNNKNKMFISSFERDEKGHLIKKMKRTDLKNMQESLLLSKEFKLDLSKIGKLNSLEKEVMEQIKQIHSIFKKGVYFHGVKPLNKTLILQNIVKDYLTYTNKQNNKTAAYVDMKEIRSYFSNSNVKIDFDHLNSIVKAMIEVDMLAIDNFFQHTMSEWIFDKFYFEVIKKRFSENKLTFIGSEFTFADILKTDIKSKTNNSSNFDVKIDSFVDMLRSLTQSLAIDEKIKLFHG